MEFVLILKCFILKWNLCSFAWSKEPKIKAEVLLLKRRSRFLLKIFPPRRFILFTPEMLILSVIFCEASSKSQAFQFVYKTQQSQGQRLIWNWELWFNYEINLSWFCDDFFWNEISVLLLDQKDRKIKAVVLLLKCNLQSLLRFSPFAGKCFLFNW